MPYTEDQLLNIPDILSAPRFATYLQSCNGRREEALKLYQWNLEISSAFLTPLHLLEISLRNAVVEALESVYSVNWPWDSGFVLSLPNPKKGYSPRTDLLQVRNNSRNSTVGKVVAELKFAFWQHMFTARHDTRIWDLYLYSIFPNPVQLGVSQLRQSIYTDLDSIRKDLRNRIAHHEPIYNRNLQNDYNTINKLVSYRSSIVSAWMDEIQDVVILLSKKP